jgi:uroporphyrin-III C-methyltransferase
MKMPGRVFLVGAGPGDPDLLTVKAVRLISTAEVIVFDRLVSEDILAFAAPGARMIPVGKEPRRHPVPQDQINQILIRQARAGTTTVRLKGGDPFIFGRGSEEALALRNAGVPCEIVPGITAAQGCAARTSVPLTHRGLATSVRYITGHCKQDQPLDFDWDRLADPSTTLVVYMGAANIAEISSRLIAAGLSSATPVLAVNNGTTAHERRLVSDLGEIAEATARERFEGPVLFIIGAVVMLYSSRDICPVVREAMALSAAPLEASAHV